ncbi:MAG: DUF177 domain-containing protein [Anaerolineae bacterium]|nr:DUF177 domain-containing protein [Anaerolineae bacterium]
MQYNVAELLKGPSGATRQYQVDEEPQFQLEGARLVGQITGSVRLMRTQKGILVEADLSSQAEVDCARCLKKAETTLTVHIADEYRPTVDIRTGFRVWPEPDEVIEEELLIGPNNVLDLDEAARQELEASVPLKTLCTVACAGICPRCGQDLNEGPCECEPEPDARWEALRQVFNQAATQ